MDRLKMKNLVRVILVVTALILAACGGASTDEAATLAPVPAEFSGQSNPLGLDAAAEGADIFETTCTSCHGPEGHGDGPVSASLYPPPKNLAELQTQVGDDYLFWRISEGKAGTAMIAWQGILPDEQIWQVVAFIRTLK